MAAWGFCFKLALGVTIGVTGAALQRSAFTPNQEQTRVAEFTIRSEPDARAADGPEGP